MNSVISNYYLPSTSLEKLLPLSAAPPPGTLPGPAHHGKRAGREVSGGRAGRNHCGDRDGVMELMSGNGEEKLLHSPSSVAVSCANRDEPILPLHDFITNYPFLTSFPTNLFFPSDEKR